MKSQVVELVNWLNSYDKNLIKRLRAQRFSYQLINWDTYEIKNNLGKILIKKGYFFISFNNGWSFLSTYNQDTNPVQIIKEQIRLGKIAVLLSALPAYRVTDYPSLLINLWYYLWGRDTVGWEQLSSEEIVNIVLPYIQKTKSELRQGQVNKYEFWELQLKEIEQELMKVKSCPELIQLIALLET